MCIPDLPRIEMGKKYLFEGRPCRVLCTDRVGLDPVLILTANCQGVEQVRQLDPYGRDASGAVHLKEIRPRIKWAQWFNIYSTYTSGGYHSKAEADKYARTASEPRRACKEIIIDCEEGEGL